jgi:uncharacterized DUF497 family protein
MRFEFDPEKSARNERMRGLPFGFAGRLFESIRVEWQDRRKDYGEIRINTLGEIEGRVYCASFTRRGEAVRIISFRKASAREMRLYRAYLRERIARGED